MVKGKLVIFNILLLLCLSFSTAYYGYSSSNLPSSIIINQTTTNVNNSQFLENHPASYFYPYSNPFSFYNSTTLPNLNSSGLIKDWNADGYIKDWNSSGLIINWTIDTSNFYLKTNPYSFWNDTYATFNKTYADTLYAPAGAGNSSWNQSLADTLYYSITNPYSYYNSSNFVISDYYQKSNPYGYYNITTLPNLNSSGLIRDWNSTGLIANWSIDTSNFYLNTNPYGFYNITTAPIYKNDTFAGNYSNYLTLFNWNKTYADTLYYSITNPFGFYNSTNLQPMINTSYYLASNPSGFYNQTNFNISDYYLKSNPYGYYNITTAPIYVNDTFAGNYSDYLTKINWSQVVNGTLALNSSLNNYLLKTEWNATNTSYYLATNPFNFYNSTTLTTNSQLLNGNNYWNNTYATFNKSYADTVYEPLLPSTPVNPETKYLNGLKQWSAIAIGAGGYAGNLYFTNINSTDVAGYKQISYINDLTQVELSGSITNQEVLLRTYLYEGQLATTSIDAGIWVANYQTKVSNAVQSTKLKMEVFVRHLNGTERTLWSDYSPELDNTDYAIIRSESNQPQFIVESTDRLGVRIYANTTSPTPITVYTIIGDGDASYFTTPLSIRHSQLRDLNGDNNYLHYSNTGNITTTGNITASNINAINYLTGQPITGSIGSGIIWTNGTNSFAEVNVSCTGLSCSYNAFKVRLVNTSNIEKYCDIPAGTVTITDNQQSVYYVDNNCNIQSTTMSSFILTPLSPGGTTDFMNVIAVNGQTYNANGLSTENKRIIKLRKLLFESTGKHLSIVNGFSRVLNAFPSFNITQGNYVYLMDIVTGTAQNTSTNKIEAIYHTGSNTWGESDGTGLNITTCDTGTGIATCSNTNLYRRIFIFEVGYNDTVDQTQLHQLLPSQSITYSNLAQCLDTQTYPLTYTLPSFYQYGSIMLYAYCAKPSDTTWGSGWIDLRTVQQASASGGVDVTAFVPYVGATKNVDIDGYNLTGTILNGTTVYSGNRNLSIGYDYATNGSYYLNSNPNSYYNSTSLNNNNQLTNGNNYWNSTFATFNKTYADTLYANTTWAYNQTTPAINTILGFNYYNLTNAPIYLNDTFRGSNYSTFLTHIDWSKAVNGTLALNSSLSNYYLNSNPFGYYNSTSFNINDYYLKTNPYGYYNITTAPTYVNDTFSGNYSTFLTHITWANAINGTLALASSIPTNNNQLTNGNNYWNSTFATFNKTYADSLYYGLSNPYSYYNSSTIPSYMPSAYATNNTFYPYSSNPANYLTSFTELDPKAYNGTLAFNSSLSNYLLKTEWNATNASYYLASNPSGYIDWSKAVNGTLALASSIPTNNNQLLNGNGYYNSSNFVITDYYQKSNPYGYYNSTSFDINNYYLKSNPYSYYNVTTAPTYLNDTFRGSNYTTFLSHITWANVVNGTLALASSIPTNNNQLTNGNNYWNSTFATFNKTYADTLYYGIGNSYGYYNSTTIPAYVTWANVNNGTMAKVSDLVNYNSSGLIKDWNATGYIKNWWVDAYNGTLAKTDATNTFTANQTLGNSCLVNQTGGAFFCHNGTGWVISG